MPARSSIPTQDFSNGNLYLRPGDSRAIVFETGPADARVERARIDADGVGTGLLGGSQAVLIDPFEQYVSKVGTWVWEFYGSTFNAKWIRPNPAAQNNQLVYAPRFLQGGTWALAFAQYTGTDRGIATFSISLDGVAWTDLGTIDGYAASGATNRTVLTGLTIAGGTYYIRVKVATKNASSSDYNLQWSGLYLTRTGA